MLPGTANFSSDSGPLLRLEGVKKSFGVVHALKGVDFELLTGEIHALLGENGAGKSTLIKILGGIHPLDAGRIIINGKTADIRSVADADSHGIRIIHQELSLAPNLSVAENIYLGRETTWFGFLNRKKLFAQAEQLITTLGFTEIRDVQATVSDLSVAHQQLVEIARALSCQARILVLDEPTSSLSEAETEFLFSALLKLSQKGAGIVYISHRLEEIVRLSHRITVLRDGESIGTQETNTLNKQQLVSWMVGREISDHFQKSNVCVGREVMHIRNLRNSKIHGVSFTVHAGEILGFAGLVGSGRSELARAIFGIDPIQTGNFIISDQEVRIKSPADALEAGIVLVPEDRKLQGLVVEQALNFNLALPWVNDWISACRPDLKRRDEIVERAIWTFAIKTSDPYLPVSALSGGNQQKALLGRWMEHPPKILILDEPTRGVDVGAREEIFSFIVKLAASGIAVMLISSDLSEVLSLSHRIAIYRDGRILQLRDREECTPEIIMEQLTGASLDQSV